MPTADQVLQTYQQLAAWHEEHGPPQLRDRFLILAADAAFRSGRDDEAERLRQRLLHLNPHHMLKPFGSFVEALDSPDVRSYVADLRQSYPPEIAEAMLQEIQGKKGPAEPEATLPMPPPMPVAEIDPPTKAPPARPPDPVVVYWENTGPRREPEPPAIPLRPEPTPRAAPAPRPSSGSKSKPARSPAPAKQPAPAPAPPPEPARPAPIPGKLARMAAARRQVQPLPVEPAPISVNRRPGDAEDEEHAHGSWVAGALFGFVLMLGGALAIYTLARPFLPPAWLP